MTAGAGGFVDITARAKRIVFSGFFTAAAGLAIESGALAITREGKVRKLVEAVEHVSFSGTRARRAGPGHHLRYRALRAEADAGRHHGDRGGAGRDLERDVLQQSEFPLARLAIAPRHGGGAVPARADRPRPRRAGEPRCRPPGRGRRVMTEVVRCRLADEVATITLARPDKLNALDGAMIAGLQSAAERIEGDRSVRVAILTGEGKAFCAGGDIAAWGSLTPLEMGQDWVRTGHRVFDRLARLKVPMIAALNGHALGGGLELAATADLRICERRRSSACRRPASAWSPAGRARSAW